MLKSCDLLKTILYICTRQKQKTNIMTIKKYIFECISDAQTTVVIYANEEISAKWRMEQHVKEPSNFRLK